MDIQKEYVNGTLEWHNQQLKQNGISTNYSFVWITDEIFWDAHLKRPKGFLTHEAHFMAILWILFGKADHVFVQPCREFYRQKYHLS